MSDAEKPYPETGDTKLDPWHAIREFKRTPIRAGCFGCTLTGWAAVFAIAGATAVLLFLARHFLR